MLWLGRLWPSYIHIMDGCTLLPSDTGGLRAVASPIEALEEVFEEKLARWQLDLKFSDLMTNPATKKLMLHKPLTKGGIQERIPSDSRRSFIYTSTQLSLAARTPPKKEQRSNRGPAIAKKRLAFSIYMGASKNRGENPPKWMVYNGKPY